ncbi:Uncharacterised protein [Mycobacterium tuberculosis]|uniref:Uncharacterized protein n=1 Tax=Mycobacterium tuberculosis TaxID=1773 RepID=A0A916LGZ3_MYCTX|nr:Uncharacterised protein [Mycobacterium tuberculosis]CPB60170.1 Uncharacterised protein [Mycobacterium tuberculosis]SIP67520.1 hypothetical protein BN9982_70027 [Mycobacterium tuberculosis]
MLEPGLRPGNFENVIQNILYLFSVPPPRCSVFEYRQIPGSPGLTRSTGRDELPGIGIARSTDVVAL